MAGLDFNVVFSNSLDEAYSLNDESKSFIFDYPFCSRFFFYRLVIPSVGVIGTAS